MCRIVVLGKPAERNELVSAGMNAVVFAVKICSVASHRAREVAGRAGSAFAAPEEVQAYDKHCSTCDSTAEGSTNTITGALADAVGPRRAILMPAMPVNGCTSRWRHLFVQGQLLLLESPLRSHPLNPMRDSQLSVVQLLQAQASRPVGQMPLATVCRGAKAFRATLDEAQAAGCPSRNGTRRAEGAHPWPEGSWFRAPRKSAR